MNMLEILNKYHGYIMQLNGNKNLYYYCTSNQLGLYESSEELENEHAELLEVINYKGLEIALLKNIYEIDFPSEEIANYENALEEIAKFWRF